MTQTQDQARAVEAAKDRIAEAQAELSRAKSTIEVVHWVGVITRETPLLLADHTARGEEAAKWKEQFDISERVLAEHERTIAAQAEEIETKFRQIVAQGFETDHLQAQVSALTTKLSESEAREEALRGAMAALSAVIGDVLHADVNPNLVTVRRHRMGGWLQRIDAALTPKGRS
jgi:uncharacterized coiled-coil protein SlyX